jgi:hypothetical protein
MAIAYPKQKLQDWITQQWVIFRGKKITASSDAWLLGPMGDLGSIDDSFIGVLAKNEGLIIERNATGGGLVSAISDMGLSIQELKLLRPEVARFYENTANYSLDLKVQWNPFFKPFGVLVNLLFSNRINQLNVPIKKEAAAATVSSEIINLRCPISQQIKYTIWYRRNMKTGKVMYSGIYGKGTLANGTRCIKVVFPLPKGNATVFLRPSVLNQGVLQLDGSGKTFGDAGFYFLLQDKNGSKWGRYHGSFRDVLVVKSEKSSLIAKQTMTLWGCKVVEFFYEINRKRKTHQNKY